MNHVVVVPYPGRGHINPLLNLCHLLSSRFNNTTVFTVVVTEEWLGLISPDLKQAANIRFASIPNVLPSELHRGSNMIAFLTAVNTKMERPFEEVLDQMELPVEFIIGDGIMRWPFEVANRRNIPVAAYWPMSASMFSLGQHVDLLESNHHLYLDVSVDLVGSERLVKLLHQIGDDLTWNLLLDPTEKGKESIDYIPGMSSLTVADLPVRYHAGIGQRLKGVMPDHFEATKNANYILISTIYELESEVIDALKVRLQMPIYTSGPNIPYSQIKPNPSSNDPIYIKWLDTKPPRTILYVSLGSFLSISSVETEEIAAGLRQSGVNFLWVARKESSHLKEICVEEGMVVEWCDQIRVLSHSSIGGFWTHCGWNSVKESLFAGVPMLTFPISLDQPLNSKAITQDWKVGKKIRKEMGVLKKDEIAEVVSQFMDSKSVERSGIMERAKKLQKVCQESIVDGGSANKDLEAFVNDIVTNRKK